MAALRALPAAVAVAAVLAAGLPALAGAAPRRCGMAEAPDTGPGRVAGATAFDIRASVLGFGSRRSVNVQARFADPLSGRLDVRFDRPLRAQMGIREVDFRVRIVDAATGELVGTLAASVGDGCQAFTLPFTLPGPGTYRFEMSNDDLDAGYARMRILPDGTAAMIVHALPRAEPLPAVLRAADAAAPAPVENRPEPHVVAAPVTGSAAER